MDARSVVGGFGGEGICADEHVQLVVSPDDYFDLSAGEFFESAGYGRADLISSKV